jgi:CheY-like chemotaxis protein
VHRAADPVEALRLIEQAGFAQRLRLAIISGHPPSGMSGPEFVAELISRCPRLPILVLGADPEQARTYEQLEGCVHFLARPIAADRLLAAARGLLPCETRRTA